jgi:gamma-glutamyltranspeptidase/glutathione hydrolase
MLAQALTMLTPDELRSAGRNTDAYIHLLAEVCRGALVDRFRYVADPDQQPVNATAIIDPRRLAQRRRGITADRTHSLPVIAAQEHGTHALVVADRDGNVVSLTTTVNRPFGAGLTGRSSGIVLNDELDDFTASQAARALGLPANPNRALPRARPVSSMTPTIVIQNGAPVLALGGSGGLSIAPNVVQTLLSRLVFGTPPGAAVAEPRFTIPVDGPTVEIEPTAASLAQGLQSRGEAVSVKPSFSAVQMIAFDGTRKLPAADPRKSGTALAE